MGLVRKFRAIIGSDLAGEPSDGKSTSWQLPYETLRKRWNAVPTTRAEFESTTKLIDLPDQELLAYWEKARTDITAGPEFAHRGWYHALYAESMRGKKVMDIGSGFGVDSITFAQHGARLTFAAGKVVKAEADKGEEFLRAMIAMDKGSGYLGEAAIGTNYNIKRYTKNTLFDEKIGGTIHLALGAGYPETGNKNRSGLSRG